MHQHALLTLALSLCLSAVALADCACGYTINRTHDPDHAIFTDLLESDFLHTYEFSSLVARDMGWLVQEYNQTNSSGPFGMAKRAENVAVNPIERLWDWGGRGMNGGDPGLQLWVKGEVVEGDEGVGYVPTAEIVSERDDILYGSFRIAMKTTNVNGTCAAFFFYRNDTQEVDVEILSAQQHASLTQWPVNMVVQNTTFPLALNGSGPQSSNFEFHMVRQPNGEEGERYQEYRFDWLPDRIDFYVDTWHVVSFAENIPSTPGRIHFSHWSNGNPRWTHGPPVEDAVMTVAYIKAYFNSTSSRRLNSHDCNSPQWRSDNNALCEIPDQHESPWPGGPEGNDTGKTFFFSRELSVTREGEHTIHDPREGSAAAIAQVRRKAWWTLVGLVLVPGVAAVMSRYF